MRMIVGAALLAVGALSGCASSKPLNELSYTETKQLAQELHKRCAEQGAPMGSKEFDACMRQEVSREAVTRHKRDIGRRRAMIAMGQSMSQMGSDMQRRNTYVHCTSTPSSTWVGGPVTRVNTSCY